MQRKLTAEKLATAIRETLADDALKRRADMLGKQIRAENGVANAVAFVKWYMQPKVG